MARKNGIGRRELSIPTQITDYYYDSHDNSLHIGDLIYINAKGDVLLCCDLSYKSQKKHVIGNVMTEPLETIIRRNLRPQELQQAA